MNADFPYHNALVTGASSGLGAALCRELLKAGCTVWGTSRDAARIGVPGVIPVSVDLAHADSIRAFTVEMQMELGQIDLLVNNAGYGVFGNLEDTDPEDIHDQVELMLTAPALLCQAVLPGMKARGQGCIANVSSLAVRFPLPGMTLYNASKAGLSSFSQSLADETRRSGICVIDFQPSDFRSGFMDATRNMGGGDAAWTAMEKHMRNAPDSTSVAQDLVRIIQGGRCGTFCSGSFFQARLAPLAHRLLPQRVMRFLQRLYMKS
ncbi:MAG: SDR family NAD(P)-dependent oxidoreductase [Opitutales bacterium]